MANIVQLLFFPSPSMLSLRQRLKRLKKKKINRGFDEESCFVKSLLYIEKISVRIIYENGNHLKPPGFLWITATVV